uniref:Uncharacterized protein n=1 Tax=Amphimedon queenslandica TaxID=400682 RepID=A0A1X7VR09_AMPQE
MILCHPKYQKPFPVGLVTGSFWFYYISIQYFFLDVDNQSTIISSDEGYIARDVLGKRALQTGTTVMSGMFYSYSYLDILNKNASYETIWDSDGNRTCYIYDNDSPGLMPMWDWIQNATYIGSDFNEDIWMYY